MVSSALKDRSAKRLWNLPNKITMARIASSVFLFVLLHFEFYGAGLGLFAVAASTDWIDGRIARRRGQITQLGRILDPLADKLIICGTFVFLSANPQKSLIEAWMTVVVVARELIVTVIRSFLEQQGKDFSASMPGKLKMVFQCAAAIASLLLLWMTDYGSTIPTILPSLVTVAAWLAVIFTLYSGVIYVFAAVRLMSDS